MYKNIIARQHGNVNVFGDREITVYRRQTMQNAKFKMQNCGRATPSPICIIFYKIGAKRPLTLHFAFCTLH